MSASKIGGTVVAIALTLITGLALAEPLKVVTVAAPAVNCVYDPSCTITVTDSIGDIPVPGITGSAILQSRTFTGAAGAPAAGMTGYEYRVDLTQAAGDGKTACVTRLKIDVGLVKPLPYAVGGALADVYVVTSGGIGTVALASADQSDGTITFAFTTPVCAGASPSKRNTSFFFGLTSAKPPRAVTAQVQVPDGQILNVAARAPAP